MTSTPLPFQLRSPGTDTVGLDGIASVSYRADGLLHLGDDGITLEWTETRTTEQVSLEKIGTDTDQLPLERLDLPMDRIAGAWLIGGWWWPRLELRARDFEDFAQVPAVRGITLRLRIHRRDRELARAIAMKINQRVEGSVHP